MGRLLLLLIHSVFPHPASDNANFSKSKTLALKWLWLPHESGEAPNFTTENWTTSFLMHVIVRNSHKDGLHFQATKNLQAYAASDDCSFTQ